MGRHDSRRSAAQRNAASGHGGSLLSCLWRGPDRLGIAWPALGRLPGDLLAAGLLKRLRRRWSGLGAGAGAERRPARGPPGRWPPQTPSPPWVAQAIWGRSCELIGSMARVDQSRGGSPGATRRGRMPDRPHARLLGLRLFPSSRCPGLAKILALIISRTVMPVPVPRLYAAQRSARSEKSARSAATWPSARGGAGSGGTPIARFKITQQTQDVYHKVNSSFLPCPHFLHAPFLPSFPHQPGPARGCSRAQRCHPWSTSRCQTPPAWIACR